MSDRQTVATVPDAATARLLAEVLTDGGIENVEVHTTTGVAYMPRASALDYEIRVPLASVARARLVLRDFEETSGQAATSQAEDAVHVPDEDEDAAPLSRRKPWVLWAAVLVAICFLAPILFSALGVAWHFVRGLASS